METEKDKEPLVLLEAADIKVTFTCIIHIWCKIITRQQNWIIKTCKLHMTASRSRNRLLYITLYMAPYALPVGVQSFKFHMLDSNGWIKEC